MARPTGFEPVTHCLEGSCSIHLSYGRMNNFGREYRQKALYLASLDRPCLKNAKTFWLNLHRQPNEGRQEAPGTKT